MAEILRGKCLNDASSPRARRDVYAAEIERQAGQTGHVVAPPNAQGILGGIVDAVAFDAAVVLMHMLWSKQWHSFVPKLPFTTPFTP